MVRRRSAEHLQWRPSVHLRGRHLEERVVGLFETVSAGSQRLPDSPDVERWPWALGVRPLAAIPPPQAEQVPGQQGPRNPTPVYVYDEEAWPQLYAAVADSPPPPGPKTVEQRVQEVEWTDLGDDVVQAVFELGTGALWADVFARTIEIGEWTEEELAARAWYTGGDESSHIKATVGQAIRLEQNMTGRIGRNYGSGPFHLRVDYQPPANGFGATYRPAGDRTPTQSDEAPHRFDLDKLERATARHMKLQDLLAGRLRQRGIEPRSPAPSQPTFDLAFGHAGKRFVVEVKSGLPVTTQQVRLGIGQVHEYAHLLREPETDIMPILLLEGRPPPPWPELMDTSGSESSSPKTLTAGSTSLSPRVAGGPSQRRASHGSIFLVSGAGATEVREGPAPLRSSSRLADSQPSSHLCV